MAGDRRTVGLLAAVGVLLLATAGVALTGAFGSLGAGGPATPTDGVTPTGDGSATATPVNGDPPFTLGTRAVEECGTLCRSVTLTVRNEQSTAARNVTVTTRLYAGNGTDGEAIWTDTELVGRLGPGQNYTATRRVELTPDAAVEIQAADGWVTVRTTVASAGRRHTVTDRRQVT